MKKISLLWVLSVFVTTLLLAQNNYYVSAELGADTQGHGLSPEKPFQTIDYGVGYLSAGDTLNIMAGIYYNATFGDGDLWKEDKTVSIVNKNGDADAWIVIRPYRQEAVKFRGDGLYIFQIRNCSYLRVEGFEIEGEVENIPLDSALAYQFAYRENGSDKILYRVAPGTPPEEVKNRTFELLYDIQRPSYFDTKGLVVQFSHHIEIVDNHIHHAPGAGMRVQKSAYIYVIGNEVNDCSRRSYSGTHGLVLEAIDGTDESEETKVWVLQNYVHHNYNEIYSWSPSKTIITPVIDEGKGISLQRNTPEYGWERGRILIANNLTHHNGFSGLHANVGKSIDFINNTSYFDSFTGNGNNHGISIQACEDVRIMNNVVVNDIAQKGYAIAASSSSSDYTVINNLVGGTIDADIEAVATNTIFADPLFVNPALFDFSLQAPSSGIDAALKTVAPTVDFNGQPRGDKPDLGAFEYQPPTAVIPISQPANFMSIYPNPFTDMLYMDGEEEEDIRFFDLLGKEHTQKIFIKNNGRHYRLNTAALKAGIYLVYTRHQSQLLVKQ